MNGRNKIKRTRPAMKLDILNVTLKKKLVFTPVLTGLFNVPYPKIFL